MVRLEPKHVRYIKLGPGGAWASDAIADGVVPFGYREIAHELCVQGDWKAARTALEQTGRTPSGLSQGVREVRDFYELDADTLWITFADGHLWWCLTDPEVVALPDAGPDRPARMRKTLDGWHRQSLAGEALTVRSLSSALTRVASYRMTICKVGEVDYLLRRIRGEQDPLHERAIELQDRMQEIAVSMIRNLDWREFETLVDLVFTRGGWRRTSVLGKNMPDVDLILEQPVTGETAWVQVKTGTSQAELDDYRGRFDRDGSCERFFFVCHDAGGKLQLPADRHLHLWTDQILAGKAIFVGLFDWLIERTR
ncbi:MAG: restriction endonuclease [Rhizobiaceae bacterium]|nr:restriction endonuclease [Rhizobiaceae bacterium]